MRRLTQRDEQRFWAKVDKSPGHGPEGDCWLWTAAARSDGYGVFCLNGRTWAAHRLALRLSGRKINPKLVVMHMCDVRRCCNPAHLRLGTQSENAFDASAKGRLQGRARKVALSDAEIVEIRAEYEHGLSKKLLSRKWRLHGTTLTRLLRPPDQSPSELVKGVEAYANVLREIRMAAKRILDVAAPPGETSGPSPPAPLPQGARGED
jgi:hypothetical protein